MDQGRALPPEMKRVAKMIQTWRSQRPTVQPMPEELWLKAITLADAHGLGPTSRGLKIDFGLVISVFLFQQHIRDREGQQAGVSGMLAALIRRQVPRYASQPPAEIRSGFKNFPPPVSHEEGFLRQVIHPRFLHAQRPDEGAQPGLVLAYQAVKILNRLALR